MKKILTILFALIVLTACESALQKPSFVRMQKTKVSNVNLLSGSASMFTEVVFNNPNNFGVQAKDALLKIYIENNYVGDLVQTAPIDVKPKSEFSLPLSGTFKLKEGLNSAGGLLSKSKMNYRVDGTIRVGKKDVYVTVPVQFSDSYDISSLINF